jgi:hypothetical protein
MLFDCKQSPPLNLKVNMYANSVHSAGAILIESQSSNRLPSGSSGLMGGTHSASTYAKQSALGISFVTGGDVTDGGVTWGWVSIGIIGRIITDGGVTEGGIVSQQPTRELS